MAGTNCQHHEDNIEKCNCTYDGCPRHGTCCLCLHYHREQKQLPACYFSPSIEKTYDRSIENFIRHYK
ncbi:MAG: hypothetical protein KAI63_01360 [Planctomycetes bacterium]|nr:hypothetical protein [Planctomycetota bacterium]